MLLVLLEREAARAAAALKAAQEAAAAEKKRAEESRKKKLMERQEMEARKKVWEGGLGFDPGMLHFRTSLVLLRCWSLSSSRLRRSVRLWI